MAAASRFAPLDGAGLGHNDRVDRRRPRARSLARLSPSVLIACLALVASGCSSGSDDPAADESPSGETPASAAEATEPYLPVPDGVELTDQGSELDFGDVASVAWRPRTTTTGVLDVEVAAVQRAPLSVFSGFRLDKQTRQSAAYFVRVKVTNAGESDLSGTAVPLYLVDEENTLIEASTFASRFEPCPSRPFPRGFAPGETVTSCQVYLAPDKGDAEAVSFRPTQAFNPIVWTGEPSTYAPKGTKKNDKASRRNQQNNQQNESQQQ